LATPLPYIQSYS